MIQGLLKRLRDLGYTTEVAGDKVRFIRQAEACPDPTEVARLAKALKRHKAEVLVLLQAQAPETPDIPSCDACPWCLDNPWTHNPELPKWCGWWWNHLEADSPQCRDRREGRVPDPMPGDFRTRPPRNGPMISPTRHISEEGKGLPFTCFDCVHFDPVHPSPNPNQAWGECRRLGKGRYWVARACDAFQKASQ
jgi:hypothetical protein